MKFHRRVPSFSFSTFSFNTNETNQNHEERDQAREQEEQLHPPPLSAPSTSTSLVTQQQRNRSNHITLFLDPQDPLQFLVSQSASIPSRKRSGSLVEPSKTTDTHIQPRRSSLAETFNQLVVPERGRRLSNTPLIINNNSNNPSPQGPISAQAPPNLSASSSGSSHFNRHRKRFSNLFSPLTSHHTAASRSPSPAVSHGRHRNESVQSESDRESHFEPPPIDLDSSESDDDSDDSNSNLSQSDRSDQLDPTDSEDETILANTHANASSITPIDFLQKSNQPIPFLDQAPNITSPPPLPISFVPSDPTRFPSATTPTTPITNPTTWKPSLSSRSSIRRRTSSIGARQDLQLTVSRPIYQKNRCTITIEHGNWARAVDKAERTRFYLVACDLSDESKYAIEWTIGTVLRQGDECLIIMIIETDSKFDPEDGTGSAADRTAKIRNQKDRQEKATLLVREATSLLERTGLNAKVTCQAVHGKNPRHMLVDCIDYLQPNLVIVGRRGMTSAKGSLMGSVSHYLVQKSSVPVMVARRRLKTLPKVYKKKHGVIPNSTKLTDASIEKSPNLSNEEKLITTANSNSTIPSVENKRLSVVSEEQAIDQKLQLNQSSIELNNLDLNHNNEDLGLSSELSHLVIPNEGDETKKEDNC